MKKTLSCALAALLSAGAASLAIAQQPPIQSQQGTPLEPRPAVSYVSEPVASVSRSDDLANAIAQALNADQSLKGSKITVQPDDKSILLTGATTTEAQRVQAGKIAASHAGGLPVVNTTSSPEVVISVPLSEKQRNEQRVAEGSSDLPAEQPAEQPAGQTAQPAQPAQTQEQKS